MKFHDIDAVGNIKVQEVQSLPTYTATDKRRLIYVTDENAFYTGYNSGWYQISTTLPLTGFIYSQQDTEVSCNTEWQDDYEIRFGDDNDISLKFDETQFKIEDVDNNTLLSLSPNAEATLYYNGTWRGKTTNTGFTCNGEFEGRATSAEYADLAEKYITDNEYPEGTIMQICIEDNVEMCAMKKDSESFLFAGIISKNPAFLMNKNIQGQNIGLIGRLPIRVIGEIYKGDKITIYDDGIGIKGKDLDTKIAVALETNTNKQEKLVECFIK